MPRNMLQLRIEALTQHLSQAQDPSVWRQTLDLPKFNVDDLLWDLAVEKIHAEAGAQLQRLEQLATRLRDGKVTEHEGWRQYSRIQAASDEVFRECLDLLGGLALRDRIQDEHICRVADEYIKELSSDTGRRGSFAIPGMDAGASSILRRVAKMQFPEWTVWTLPLVAYEYGHVVIEESGIRRFAADLAVDAATEEVLRDRPDVCARLLELGTDLDHAVRDLAREDADLDEAVARLAERVGDEDWHYLSDVFARHRSRVRILLADVLATLLAGPAYTYAALLLRLNPLSPEVDGVSDQDRAATILATLRLMNEPEEDGPAPYGDTVERLERYWQASTAEAKAESPDLAAAALDSPPALDPDRVRTMFRFHIVGHRRALYDRTHWIRAEDWSADWQKDLSRGIPLRRPATGPNEHLREAINAVWQARIEATHDLDSPQGEEAKKRVELFERVGLELCEAIMVQRRDESDRSDPGGGARPGPAPQSAVRVVGGRQ
ncbi:MAG: hypothetical protein ABJA87_03700 [bacterium]